MKVRLAAITAAATLSINQCSVVQNHFLDEGLPVPPTQQRGQAEGAFRLVCRGGHVSYDDPIVAPRVDNATHLHQFFGNLDIDQNTTRNNIGAAELGSTCQGGRLNASGYWVPALIDSSTRKVVPIDTVIVYYKGEPHHSAGPVKPLPEGLRMISDNGSWSCAGVSTGDIIAPKCSGALMASVDFRFCWNGQLDSPDHRSHLANSFYANGVERCPATHPTVIPRISYKITYNTAGLGPSSGYSLSSDHDSSMSKRPSGQVAPRGSTLHGDYMYGWYAIDTDTGKSFARVWYDNCLAGFKNCDFGDLGDSRRLRAWPDEATVQKATPAPAPLPPNALHH